MPKEIERKFLVSGNEWRKRAGRGKAIRQAYLALTNTISLRVRIVGKTKAFVTIKGARSGAVRSEFEYPIPVKDAHSLMKLRVGRVIRKRRHVVKAGHAHFEIDVFEGDHRGLVIAEIELASARARFKRPEWLGREVTREKRYYNANMAIAGSRDRDA
jgi:adenylate cyclase